MSNVVELRPKPLTDLDQAVISGFQAAEDALMECKAEGLSPRKVAYETAVALYEDMFASTPELARAELASFVQRMLEFVK